MDDRRKRKIQRLVGRRAGPAARRWRGGKSVRKELEGRTHARLTYVRRPYSRRTYARTDWHAPTHARELIRDVMGLLFGAVRGGWWVGAG
jgi:hypothetical protein